MPKKFSPELRDRAVRMVYERQAREGGPRAESIRAIAPQLGVGLVNRPGSGGGSQPMEDESHGSTQEVQR